MFKNLQERKYLQQQIQTYQKQSFFFFVLKQILILGIKKMSAVVNLHQCVRTDLARISEMFSSNPFFCFYN